MKNVRLQSQPITLSIEFERNFAVRVQNFYWTKIKSKDWRRTLPMYVKNLGHTSERPSTHLPIWILVQTSPVPNSNSPHTSHISISPLQATRNPPPFYHLSIAASLHASPSAQGFPKSVFPLNPPPQAPLDNFLPFSISSYIGLIHETQLRPLYGDTSPEAHGKNIQKMAPCMGSEYQVLMGQNW